MKLTQRMLAALAVTVLAGGYATAQSSGAARPAPTAGAMTVGAPMSSEAARLPALEKTAAAADTKISSPSAAPQRLTLARAVRAHDAGAAKAALAKAGFSAEQLASAKIVLADHTGGGPVSEKVKVEIRASCCPLTITIIISF
ncbi:MAG TPA: hypothetical protein VG248_10340 [Caulobacteraceae bacterium]|jgi:hypothetical protein|nr:hypothetical protein [Caulobacteraceae bacterium]